MNATLQLVKTTGQREVFLLQAIGAPSENADFSLYEIDGEGSGDPFDFGNLTWEPVEDLPSIDFDPEDSQSFWQAQEALLAEAVNLGILV